MADNYINVTVTSKENKRVTVSTQEPGFEVTATTDTGKFWAQTAENWAISDVKVDNKDYSSKYYANKSKSSAENASIYEKASKEIYNSLLTESDNLSDEIRITANEALENIQTTKINAVDDINSTKTNILKDIEFVADGEKEEIQELAEKAKDDIESTGFYMRDDKLYFINSKGEEEEFKSGGGSSFNLFDTKISDHILEGEEAIGWMLQGSYVNGAVYPDFYAKCIAEYNEATETETVNGVTVKVNSNGHKFYDIADKTTIDEFYNLLGSAWFYGVDIEQERIFLPRDKYFAIKGIAPVVGNGMSLGLTDGNTAFSGLAYNTSSGLIPRKEAYGVLLPNTYSTSSDDFNNQSIAGVTTDPTKSGIEAHLNANENKYLYICVGNTIVNEEQIDVGQVLSQAVLRSSLVEVQTVIETYVNGTSWYRIWSDGFCEQSGKTDKGTKIEITLLKPYKDTNYQIMVGQYHTGATDMHGTVVRNSKTVNGFTIAGNANVDFNWEVKGYIW
jgi:hypothetical protein